MHTETVRRVVRTTLVEGEEGFVWAHLEVVTMGNVRKVIRIPHLYASALKQNLHLDLKDMEEKERASSWQACVAWIKRGRK